MDSGNFLAPEDRQNLEIRLALIKVMQAWQRVENRLQSEFVIAFEHAEQASTLTARYLDALVEEFDVADEDDVVPDNDGDQYLRRAVLDELNLNIDELGESAQISGALIILVIDEQFRRICKAVNMAYWSASIGPLIGEPLHEPPTVHFTELVRASANSFRHVHEWEDLAYDQETRTYSQGEASDREFRLAMASVEVLQRALSELHMPLRGFQTLDALRVLSMTRDDMIVDWITFRQRVLATMRDLILGAGRANDYEFLRSAFRDMVLPDDEGT